MVWQKTCSVHVLALKKLLTKKNKTNKKEKQNNKKEKEKQKKHNKNKIKQSHSLFASFFH